MNYIRVLSHNVNHTPAQSHAILESLVNECDVIFIQEPYYGPIKTVASNTNPAGDVLVGTQVHPSWMLIETRTPARVCAYVNRELLGLRPQLCDQVVSHPDMLLLSLTAGGNTWYFLNVYNNPSTFAASEWLAANLDRLPPLSLVAGDFNLHHTAWEPDTLRESARAATLLQTMATCGLALANADGLHTHRPHNVELHSSVVDLVWAPADLVASDRVHVKIDLEGRGLSDHAFIHSRIPFGHWEFLSDPAIPPKSDAEIAYLNEVREGLGGLSGPAGSHLELQTLVDNIYAVLDEIGRAHV